jgi:hypothetical protein
MSRGPTLWPVHGGLTLVEGGTLTEVGSSGRLRAWILTVVARGGREGLGGSIQWHHLAVWWLCRSSGEEEQSVVGGARRQGTTYSENSPRE